MSKETTVETRIQEIRNLFEPGTLDGSRDQILDALNRFEKESQRYIHHQGLSAVIKWHKSLYLQKVRHFSRSEELLDEALNKLEELDDDRFQRWRLKIYLSLGYNHRAQCNYLDAEFYLKEALKLSLTEPDLGKFQGEIYSLLGSVNYKLNRFNKAIKYVAQERRKAHDLYQSNPAYAIIYAYSLYDYCRMTRLIGATDPKIEADLTTSVELFEKMGYTSGLLKARLEIACWAFLQRSYDRALEGAAMLEIRLREQRLDTEALEAGLLIAEIYQSMYDYEAAEHKLDEMLALAEELKMTKESVVADIYFLKGEIYANYNMDREAFEYYRESAKIGMALGIKQHIIRAFNRARKINPYPAKEFVSADLVYQDALFVKDRIKQNITPFSHTKAQVKLFASTLFLDIVGFSSLMRASREDTTVAMIDELVDRLCLIIYQNGGYIDKFLGDGFMAIFEHGDHMDADTALRSVRAGIDIHRALGHKNRKLRQAFGVNKRIKIRMGLSSGEIYAMVLGNFIKREYTYLGNSVNLASKLESLAAQQLMLIDGQTFELIKDRIMARRQEVDIPDMGRVNAYEVLRLSRLNER
ncbi:MAG: adenylate/guanylate cyclase domain-containing protein [Desulfosarcinaceae bacterium]|nr:adenylate/guanylate cyclase domain-containing protein [Desulfosarcinaceae bacterium]